MLRVAVQMSVILPSAAQEPFKHHTVVVTPELLMEMTSQEDAVVGKEIGDNNAVRYSVPSNSAHFQEVSLGFHALGSE